MYFEDNSYAKKGTAGTALGIGIGGLTAGIASGVGALVNASNNKKRAGSDDLMMSAMMGLAGSAIGSRVNNAGGSGDDAVITRHELGLVADIAAKDREIAILTAKGDLDAKLLTVYSTMDERINKLKDEQTAINTQQAVLNATNGAALGCINGQIAQMQALIAGFTKTVIPNAAICPGWDTTSAATT